MYIKLILANTELFSLKTLSRNTPKQKTDIHINSEIKQKCCRRVSCGSIFVFGSDFHPCYKIAFEKQSVRLSTVWWSRGAQGWTPLRSSGFAFKCRFYIIQRDMFQSILKIIACSCYNGCYRCIQCGSNLSMIQIGIFLIIQSQKNQDTLW